MNFLQTYTLAITTLSPIHIGCGEDYEPTNYVIDNNQLYIFDPVLLLRELSTKDREDFARIVEQQNSLRGIQRFFYNHKKTAIRVGQLSANVAAPVQDFYDSRIGQVAQREQDGNNVLNKLEIARTAFNPINGRPILPGSSIKGAIRTAVCDELLDNKRFPVSTRDASGNHLKEKDIKHKAGQQNRRMVQEVLGLSANSQLRFPTDPFRLLKISDGSFRRSIRMKRKDGTIREDERWPRIYFQVNRKKRPNQFTARGNVNNLLECIPANTVQAFGLQWVVEQKAGCSGQTPDQQLDFTTIARACNRFYLERLRTENSFLEANNYAASWIQHMKDMLRPEGIMKKMMDEDRGFLLRVGRHSGAESVTVNAPRSIKIMKGNNQSPDYAKEASTIWLAANQKNQMDNMQPFGWIFVLRF